ncbi:Crp/Fnr family transcriptional regulator [Clostridium sp. P21]|uniref:Crp/Fnr family transcriptional regulator n=1 Tax=Clostridium muellerianum TaxID=2716538 RepID=A0A7Y0HQX3_9CLOT|nr:Crp/Fnr family transcriptional regulator [Clostridium muellerianum]NMM64248.1 Crp/Fnr family transcriptional regulator [Clostridium muellerianum]
MINQYINLIKKSPLFHGIDTDEIFSLFHCLNHQIHDYNKNEFIINSGETIDKFGLVLEGEIIITKENIRGDRVVMSIIKKGGLFGEMFVFSSRKIWPVTVMAQSSCKVLFLANSDLIARCGKNCSWHTSMLANFINVISDKGLMLNKKVEYLSLKSIRSKICLYLFDQYEHVKNSTFTIPLKRNELADFLNISRPSLSREMCEMRDEGIIDFHLSTFKIKNIETLKDFCEY